jgi:hypothetical protein
MFDFKLFKKALGDYSQTLRTVRSQIDAVETEIENCLFAPVAKEDAKKVFRAWISTEAAEWRRLLIDRLASVQKNAELMANPDKLASDMKLSNLLMMGAHSGALYQGHVDAKYLQRSMIGMFEEPMWKAIESALDGLTWQPGAMTIEDRAEKLKTLREQLSKLRAQEAQLVKDAEDVGIDASGVE